MSERTIELPIRRYEIAQLYGPGMPPSCTEGYRQHTVSRKVSQVGLVLVHCWNLGESDGPYPARTDERLRGKAGDWVCEARKIISERIAPALAAARRAGLAVFHLAHESYAGRYESYRHIKDDPRMAAPPQAPVDLCVRPRTLGRQLAEQYGADFPGCVWDTHRESFDIARAVRPAEGEHVIVNGWQLNRLCRQMDIDTLVYAGFMADICLVHSSGAMREMSLRYKYNCVALRDCTVAYEYGDTAGGWMTFAAVRNIETAHGGSTTSGNFVAALNGE
jgi:nicotinamidase-related amidase